MGAERIDVLAVMDADGRAVSILIDSCNSMHRRQKWDDHLADHDLARAAVAGLIETTRALLAYRIGKYPTAGYLKDNDAIRAQLDAVASSLARVTGADA